MLIMTLITHATRLALNFWLSKLQMLIASKQGFKTVQTANISKNINNVANLMHISGKLKVITTTQIQVKVNIRNSPKIVFETLPKNAQTSERR